LVRLELRKLTSASRKQLAGTHVYQQFMPPSAAFSRGT
jgi:hypothetical protein